MAKNDFDARNVSVVENGVDVKSFSTDGQPRSSRELLFLGSLDWRPNLDGLRHFLDTSFPKVVAKIPDIALKIVGRNAPDWLLAAGNQDSNIEVYSNVPDVKP